MLTDKALNSLALDYLRKSFAKFIDDRDRFLRSSESDLKIPLLKVTMDHGIFLSLLVGAMRIF